MLRSMKDLEGYAIQATDGTIGHVKDFYFDDDAWVVRYLIVETGNWLSSRKVLISPMSIGQPDWNTKVLPVSITKERVKNSPDIDTDKPVSRQHEMQYLGYYGYPYYWHGSGLWGLGAYPGMMLSTGSYGGADAEYLAERAEQDRKTREVALHQNDDPHLRSCKAVMKYHVEATDGDIGHVQGLIVDEETWAVRYMVVDTNNWWLGHQVLVAPQWIHEVHWADMTVGVTLTRQAVKDAPLYDAAMPLSRDREVDLHRHHGRPGYWADEVNLENPEFRVAESAPPRTIHKVSDGTRQDKRHGF